MRSGTMVNGNLLPPTSDDEEETMSADARWNDSISKDINDPLNDDTPQDAPITPSRYSRRGRRRPSIVPVRKDPSKSPKGTSRKGILRYSNLPKPPQTEKMHYSQQLAFNGSMNSTDWASNSSDSSRVRESSMKSTNSLKDTSLKGSSLKQSSFKKYHGSLVFDDDVSLSLHQAMTDDDEDEVATSRKSLAESAYQLSTVGTSMQDSVVEQSMSTHYTPITTSIAEVDSSETSSVLVKAKGSNDKKMEIWGRERELSSLQSRFLSTVSEAKGQNFMSQNLQRHFWVSGVSGIGKTSLVDAFLQHDNVSVMRPIICCGAFDENWMDASRAFPGIMTCFTDLFQNFLDGDEREEWSERVQSCFEDETEIDLLVTLVPSLAILLDRESDDAKYSFKKTDKNLFRKLSCVLGRILLMACDYSIIIFSLDDVQWAGDDSLELLKTLFLTKDLRNFFFVGSHRSGIKVSHSLHRIKAEVYDLFGADLKLGGIGMKSAKLLVRSHLRLLDPRAVIDPRMLESVVKSWYKHSNSRIPIFLKHLVHRLYETGAFKVKKGAWILDSPKVLASSSLSLVVERIEDLTEECNAVLKSAALLDTNSFDSDMLMVAITADTKYKSLEIDNDSLDEVIETLIAKIMIEEHSPGHYAFAHNVVKVAISSRFSASTKRRRSGIHWRIGTDLKKLKDDATTLESDSKVGFESLLIANHWSKGLASIEDRRKIDMVIKLYLQLGEAAIQRSAFATASNILETTVASLDKKTAWVESYALALKTHIALARALYCLGDTEKAKPVLNTIIANGRIPRDTIDAFDLLISIYRTKTQYEQAKQFASKALTDIFEDNVCFANVEEQFSKIRELVQKKSDADLLVLPDLEHKKTKKEMPFLLQLAEISGLCRDYKMQDLAALRMLELTLKYGSYETNFTGLTFAYFGLCVARRNLVGEAYRYGRLAEMISEKENSLGRQAIAFHNYEMRHLRNHMRGGRKVLRDVSLATMQEDEVDNISFQVGAYLSSILYTGTPLSPDDSVLELYDEKRKQFDLPGSWNVIGPYNTLVKLRGESSKLMKRKYFEEKAFQYDLFFQMVEAVFMQNMEKAEKVNSKIFMKPRGCWGSYRLFMEGLIAAYYARLLTDKNKHVYRKKATKFADLLTTSAKTGMKNSAHMANILNVELKIASDSGVSTKRLSILFDTAISSAYQDGFPHHAALASERAGYHFLDIDDEILATKYLSRASILYAEWGAVAKVNQLQVEYAPYINTDPTQIRGLKKISAIPAGSLMFTDRNADLGTQRSGRRTSHTRRSRSQDIASASSHSRRSASLDPRPNHSLDFRRIEEKGKFKGKRRNSMTSMSSSMDMEGDNQKLLKSKRRSSANELSSTGIQDTKANPKSKKGAANELLSSLGMMTLGKEEKGKYQKFGRRNSGSSSPSTPSKEDKGKFKKFKRRNSTNSAPSLDMQETKPEKGKFQKFKRRNSTSSAPSVDMYDTKPQSGKVKRSGRRSSANDIVSPASVFDISDVVVTPTQPKKKSAFSGPVPSPGPRKSQGIFLTPSQPKKKSAFSGPVPSPGPRKTKLALDEIDNDDLEGRDYLLDYDTDDFDTVAGESMISMEDESEEMKKWKKGKKKFEEKNEKERKKAAKKKKKEAVIEEEEPDYLKTPKRKTKAKVNVRAKTLTL